MLDIEKVIAQSEENIRQALKDYAAHTYQTDVLSDVSEAFIKRLAKDNAYAKMELRELFSQSPVYDSKLDALVINGTRTHDPDKERITTLGKDILCRAIGFHEGIDRPFMGDDMWDILYFFSGQYYDDADKARYIEKINTFAPKAYKEGRKLSRVFKQLCQALGIADETAGSEFQRLYAQFADELTAKKIGFKLYVSLNPAHFITMSNPKRDERGPALTSCHSFNSTEYNYNCGCAGYARDNWSFIVFTAADPSNPETLNNRKTTRQIFAYMPGNGVLLQSRLYNTSGGTTGAQADSKLYRDLVQREISMLENAANLWRTFRCVDADDRLEDDYVRTGPGFGGYEDWIYRDFHAHISVRSDHDQEGEFERLEIGTYGLCVCCAAETGDGVYCGRCTGGGEDEEECEECGGYFYSEDLYRVRNSRGEEIWVCEDCRDRYYTRCEICDEYFPNDLVERTADGSYVCRDCLDEYFTGCFDCGEYDRDEEMYRVRDARGREVIVCESCRDRHYTECRHCHTWVSDDQIYPAHDLDGNEISICERCSGEHYSECAECGELYPAEQMEDDLCPECKKAAEDEVNDENETEVPA